MRDISLTAADDPEMDRDSLAARDAVEFWRQRGTADVSPLAVTPNTTGHRRVAWARARLQDWTLQRLRPLARFTHYVDLGCGFGDFTLALGQGAAKITGCDVSPEFVAEARRRLAEAGRTDAQIVVADIRSFADYDQASVAYLGGVLMYLDDDGALAVLRRLRERVTPDAIVAQRDWCAIGLGREATHSSPWFSVHRRPGSYIELFRRAGFAPIEHVSSLVMYADEITRNTLRHPAVARVVGPVPRFMARAAALALTRCSLTFLYRPA